MISKVLKAVFRLNGKNDGSVRVADALIVNHNAAAEAILISGSQAGATLSIYWIAIAQVHTTTVLLSRSASNGGYAASVS